MARSVSVLLCTVTVVLESKFTLSVAQLQGEAALKAHRSDGSYLLAQLRAQQELAQRTHN